jgi:hypothetical protein
MPTLTISHARINRTQYARDWTRLHHSMERQQYPNFKNALNKQTHAVLDYVKRHGTADLESHLSVLVSKQPIQEAYQKCYQNTGVKGAEFTYNKINELAKGKSYTGLETKDGPGFFSEHWRKLMNLFFHTQSSDRVTQVTETTKEQIRGLLASSSDMTLSEQATYLEDNLSSPDFNRMRALRIARTESTTGANYGAFLGAESSDYEVGKIWIPIVDMATRPDHAAMDGGLPIGIDEYFEVGSSLMKYPGDPSGAANEVINCRCTIGMVPLLNESGLPILKVA